MPAQRRMNIVRSRDEIPVFQSEDEEHVFWSTHALSDEVLAQAEPLPEGLLPPPRAEGQSESLTMALDSQLVQRLRALARRRRTGVRTLIRQFVAERLDDEERRERERTARVS